MRSGLYSIEHVRGANLSHPNVQDPGRALIVERICPICSLNGLAISLRRLGLDYLDNVGTTIIRSWKRHESMTHHRQRRYFAAVRSLIFIPIMLGCTEQADQSGKPSKNTIRSSAEKDAPLTSDGGSVANTSTNSTPSASVPALSEDELKAQNEMDRQQRKKESEDKETSSGIKTSSSSLTYSESTPAELISPSGGLEQFTGAEPLVSSAKLEIVPATRVPLAARSRDVREFVEKIDDIPELPKFTESADHQFEKILKAGFEIDDKGGLQRVADVAIQNTKMVDKIIGQVGEVYPGMIVQGKTISQDNPSELPISGDARVPIRLALSHGFPKKDAPVGPWNLQFDGNETGRNSYQKQIRDILDTQAVFPANFTYNAAKVYSLTHASYHLDANAKYMFASGGVTIDNNETIKKNVVFILLRQELYKMVVDDAEPVQNWFTNKLVFDDVKKFLEPDNPPLYIHSVSYGRLVQLVATTSESFESFNAAFSFAYNNGFSYAKISADAKKLETLSNASYQFKVYGGSYAGPSGINKDNFKDAFSGLASYFETDPEPSTALPIGFEARYLANRVSAAIKSAGPHSMRIEIPAPYRFWVKLDTFREREEFESDSPEWNIVLSGPGNLSASWHKNDFGEADSGDWSIDVTSSQVLSDGNNVNLSFDVWEQDRGRDEDSDFGKPTKQIDLADILRNGRQDPAHKNVRYMDNLEVPGPGNNAIIFSVYVEAPPVIEEEEAKNAVSSLKPPRTDEPKK